MFDKDLAAKICRLSEKCYSCMTYKTGNDGFLLETEDDSQFLLFPGSYELSDWIHDFEVVKVHRDDMGDIHLGFAKTWDLLKDEVVKRLDKTKKLYVGGHSLGGAVACVAALSLYNKGFKIESVHTYGQPRVGNYEWKKKFVKSKIQLYRFRNGDDIVSTIPKLFYWHVGEEVHINRRGFFSWLHDNFTDHLITNYIKFVEALQKR